MPLNIEELGISGFATITSVEQCCSIAVGEGSVITGRFKTNCVDLVVRLELLGPNGTTEVIEGTTVHPVWSIDRNDWVQLSELQEGEQLQCQDGPAIVLSVQLLRSSATVYNIEVHGEHVYQVGLLGLLVHNACPLAPNSAFEIAQQGGKHAGFLKNYAGKPASQIQKGINSLKKQIAEHQNKIANPGKHIPGFDKLDPRQQQALLNNKWPSDIARQQEQLEILEGLLRNVGAES